jgi:hypothetical protein
VGTRLPELEPLESLWYHIQQAALAKHVGVAGQWTEHCLAGGDMLSGIVGSDGSLVRSVEDPRPPHTLLRLHIFHCSCTTRHAGFFDPAVRIIVVVPPTVMQPVLSCRAPFSRRAEMLCGEH